MIPKFRAWDKEENKMIDWEDLSFLKTKTDKDLRVLDLIYSPPKLKDAEIMQWTGLKDTWGDEIYEGDIIRGLYDTGIIGYEWVRAEVKYDLLEGFQLAQFDLNSIEIIGNIYENPELLEDN